MAINSNEIIKIINIHDSNGNWVPIIGNVTNSLRNYFITQGILPSGEDANRLIDEAHRILSKCNPPTSSENPGIGLVCGYVQSGKTASMTAISALAKDNGYRIIILIAGITTNLVTQNSERMESHLRSASPDWTWHMLKNPRKDNELPAIVALIEEWRSNQYVDEDRRTLFITVMKNYRHLNNLTQLLSSIDLGGIPSIIFDDEADQASLNTRPNEPNASATYVSIDGLRKALPSHTFLQYTATPQAPLLITRIDSLSADFAELVSPGEGYIGGDLFFAENSIYVETIAQAYLFDDEHMPEEPPESLLHALQVYFIGVAAGRISHSEEHRSMLVHASKKIAIHRHYYDWIEAIKHNWHRILQAMNEPDRIELMADFRTAYDDLSRTCSSLPPFNQIEGKLPVAINQTTVTLVNSIEGREVQWQNSYSHILVGGEKLGRGYTVKGLTVTYMPRGPGGWTADTIQQRARFFGYHSGHFGFCRVYLHPDVKYAYIAYVRHEQDMRNRLEAHRGRPLKEWRRLFYLDHSLAPTRYNILSTPYLRPHLGDNWFAPRAPHNSPSEGLHNAKLIKLLENMQFKENARFPQHKLAFTFLNEVFENVLAPLSYLDEEDAIGLCYVNCNLKSMLDLDNNLKCLVYFMHYGLKRTRRLSKGIIPQLFQGRSSSGADSYPGDRAFFQKDLPTIQIHFFRIEDDNHYYENVPAVAIRLTQQDDILIHTENNND